MSDRFEQLIMETLGMDAERRTDFLEMITQIDGETGARLKAELEKRAAAHAPEGRPGDRIGAYTLLSKIGEGGMGAVYKARQDEPDREVALKIIRPSRATPSFSERFRWEYRILARMNHHYIARIYEAGVTAHGHPFFTMELIEGVPLDRFCKKRKLSLKERLNLFQEICAGVLHAHQQAVVHRDLKPSNILVTEENGKPVPKIIDFGIAASLSGEQDDDTGAMGTPAYMSPEQLREGREFSDVRGDVYSLGVVLYEILAGGHPVDEALLRGKSPEEARAFIMKYRPPKPSERRSPVAPRLRGDLDSIVQKAMAADPEARYSGVAQLTADIDDYLSVRPVSARNGGWFYRLRKIHARHRLATYAVLVIAVVSFVAFERDQRARWEAEKAAEDVKQIIEISTNAANPRYLQRGLEMQKISEEKYFDLSKSYQFNPSDEIDILLAFGKTLLALGDYPSARKHLEQADLLRRKHLEAESPVGFEIRLNLARVLRRLGCSTQALNLLNEIADQQATLPGDIDHEIIAGTAIALNAGGNHHEALIEFENALRVQLENNDIEKRHILLSLGGLAAALENLKLDDDVRPFFQEEAEALYRTVLTSQENLLTKYHPEALATRSNLGNFLLDKGRKQEDTEMIEKAFKYLEETYDWRQIILGRTHDRTLRSAFGLARAYKALGNSKEAWDLLKMIIEVEDPDGRLIEIRAKALNQLVAWKLKNRLPLLEDLYNEIHERGEPEHEESLRIAHNLGNSLLKPDPERARSILRDTLEGRIATNRPADEIATTRVTLGEYFEENKGLEKAVELYRTALKETEGKKFTVRPIVESYLKRALKKLERQNRK
ncbi:MAG: serine/threonine-protein kinase [Acidobacteriota bacterium]|nr:serine/threonine-protein kinase [Acidobacteriota bacterium]